MRAHPGSVAAALALLLLAGCLGRGGESRFYTLSPAPVAAPIARLERSPIVQLARVRVPRELQRPQLVTRSDPRQVSYEEFHRWAAALESQLERTLRANLESRLGSPVVTEPLELPIEADYRLRVEVRQLDGHPGDGATLRAHWAILDASGQRVLALEDSTLDQPAQGGGFDGLVDAYSAVLGQLSDQIATRIVELERARK